MTKCMRSKAYITKHYLPTLGIFASNSLYMTLNILTVWVAMCHLTMREIRPVSDVAFSSSRM